MAGNNSDIREQLIRAMEYSIFGWYHLIYQKQSRNIGQLLSLVDFFKNTESEIHDDKPDSSQKQISETSMKDYRKRLKEEFGFQVNFQSGYADYGEDLSREDQIRRILPIMSYYLHTVLQGHSDEAIVLLLKNLEVRDQNNQLQLADPLLAFYYIIAFRYAAMCGIPIDVDYRELMGRQSGPRRLLPLTVVWRSPYINLVAKDKKDEIIKQFAISSIKSLNTDLWSEFYSSMAGKATEREAFDYETYKKDPEYRFLRPIRKYTFRMTGYTFYHFRHSWNLDWQLIEQIKETEHIVSIVSDDFRTMLLLLFNYSSYIELLSEELIQPGSPDGLENYPADCASAPLPLLCMYEQRMGGG